MWVPVNTWPISQTIRPNTSNKHVQKISKRIFHTCLFLQNFQFMANVKCWISVSQHLVGMGNEVEVSCLWEVGLFSTGRQPRRHCPSLEWLLLLLFKKSCQSAYILQIIFHWKEHKKDHEFSAKFLRSQSIRYPPTSTNADWGTSKSVTDMVDGSFSTCGDQIIPIQNAAVATTTIPWWHCFLAKGLRVDVCNASREPRVTSRQRPAILRRFGLLSSSRSSWRARMDGGLRG